MAGGYHAGFHATGQCCRMKESLESSDQESNIIRVAFQKKPSGEKGKNVLGVRWGVD